MLTEVNNANGSTQISKYSYTYYVDGNQKSKTESVAGTNKGTINYTYDGLNRLVQEQTPDKTYSYQYDSYGNRSQLSVTGDETYTTSYTYDKNNRMRNQTKTTGSTQEITDFWYDPNGNQISSMTVSTGGTGTPGVGIEPAGGNGNSYSEYNSWNQLTSTMLNGKTASYTYNGDGLRMSKTVDRVTTSHIWDGMNIAGDVTNGVVTKYIRGLQLVSARIGSNENFYNYNAHGDVVQLTNSSGSIVKQYSYDAFGAEQNKSDSDTNPFRCCGEYFDVETESVYLRARYYSPVSGRFITEDPIRDELNWYSYATNNPIAFIDPLGTNDVPIYDNDSTVIDVKYDLRELVSLVGGVLKVDGNIVKIKALGKITEINIQEVAQQDKNLRVEDRHIISDHLHYTLKDFLNLIGADYSIATVQMTVTSSDVRYQKWSQRAGKTAMKVLEDSASSVVAASGVIGQAITSFASLFDGWGGNYKEILTEGFYKKQFIEIYDEHGKGIIINYIVPRPTAYSNNNLGIYVKELWNADMNEMAWAGWKYP